MCPKGLWDEQGLRGDRCWVGQWRAARSGRAFRALLQRNGSVARCATRVSRRRDRAPHRPGKAGPRARAHARALHDPRTPPIRPPSPARRCCALKSLNKLCGVWILFRSVKDAEIEASSESFPTLITQTARTRRDSRIFRPPVTTTFCCP